MSHISQQLIAAGVEIETTTFTAGNLVIVELRRGVPGHASGTGLYGAGKTRDEALAMLLETINQMSRLVEHSMTTTQATA
ncbi:MAG: hypothetical protein PF501_07585 [Salinisphaera sp.]|jgi:hypothetical protein|nr:hypothetical protein [Salinisphaera sp.]